MHLLHVGKVDGRFVGIRVGMEDGFDVGTAKEQFRSNDNDE